MIFRELLSLTTHRPLPTGRKLPAIIGTLRYLDSWFRGQLTGSNLTREDCIAHVCTTRVAVLLLSRTSELERCRPQVNVSTFVVISF